MYIHQATATVDQELDGLQSTRQGTSLQSVSEYNVSAILSTVHGSRKTIDSWKRLERTTTLYYCIQLIANSTEGIILYISAEFTRWSSWRLTYLSLPVSLFEVWSSFLVTLHNTIIFSPPKLSPSRLCSSSVPLVSLGALDRSPIQYVQASRRGI